MLPCDTQRRAPLSFLDVNQISASRDKITYLHVWQYYPTDDVKHMLKTRIRWGSHGLVIEIGREVGTKWNLKWPLYYRISFVPSMTNEDLFNECSPANCAHICMHDKYSQHDPISVLMFSTCIARIMLYDRTLRLLSSSATKFNQLQRGTRDGDFRVRLRLEYWNQTYLNSGAYNRIRQ